MRQSQRVAEVATVKVCVIVNPAAGQALWRPDIHKAIDLLRGLDWDVAVFETDARHKGTELARKAVAEGCQLVVACGGDGTINEIIQALPGTDVALGVIPTGTTNVFAREMGIPSSPLEAVKALATGKTRLLDVGTCGDRYFLLWAGVGFDAQVLLNVKPKSKRRYGIPAFFASIFLTLFKFEGRRVELIVDDKKFNRRVLLVVVSNIKRYAVFELSRDAEPDDGLFEVLIFAGSGTFTKLRHLLALALRRHRTSPEVESYRARSVTLRSEKPLPVQTDGDVIGETPVHLKMLPRSLKVVLPK
ncbi:MAG: diacylglycerol kinase family lipid kinase [Dehalococcoidia bacterium]|nr:diacylglycerol kinase family lipid kinase [Dehalococcoidia bacterium]